MQITETIPRRWTMPGMRKKDCPWVWERGSDGKEPAWNVGDPCSIPGSGRSPGEGHGNPLQYSCPESPMDREPGRLQSAVRKSWTQVKQLSMHAHGRNHSVWAPCPWPKCAPLAGSATGAPREMEGYTLIWKSCNPLWSLFLLSYSFCCLEKSGSEGLFPRSHNE